MQRELNGHGRAVADTDSVSGGLISSRGGRQGGMDATMPVFVAWDAWRIPEAPQDDPWTGGCCRALRQASTAPGAAATEVPLGSISGASAEFRRLQLVVASTWRRPGGQQAIAWRSGLQSACWQQIRSHSRVSTSRAGEGCRVWGKQHEWTLSGVGGRALYIRRGAMDSTAVRSHNVPLDRMRAVEDMCTWLYHAGGQYQPAETGAVARTGWSGSAGQSWAFVVLGASGNVVRCLPRRRDAAGARVCRGQVPGGCFPLWQDGWATGWLAVHVVGGSGARGHHGAGQAGRVGRRMHTSRGRACLGVTFCQTWQTRHSLVPSCFGAKLVWCLSLFGAPPGLIDCDLIR